MTAKKISGYEMNAQISKGMNAIMFADACLKRLISEQLPATTQIQLVARTMSSLLEITNSMIEIREISEGAKMKEKDLYQYLVGHEVDTPKGRGLVVGKIGRELLVAFDLHKNPLEVVRFVLDELKTVEKESALQDDKSTEPWAFTTTPF